MNIEAAPRWKRIGMRTLRFLSATAFFLVLLWTTGAVWFSQVGFLVPTRIFIALMFVALTAAWIVLERRHALVGLAALSVPVLIAWPFHEASNHRTWADDVSQLSTANIRSDGNVQISGFRNCNYRSDEDFDVHYESRSFELAKLRDVDFMVERFHAFKGLAHTLLSFGFENGERVCISVEIRRERDEEFGPIAGMYKCYELIYVVGSEQDLIGLRTNHRKSDVWLYPVKTTQARMRSLFEAMLTRANRLSKDPEFYNTFTNNCTTNMVDHVLALAPKRIPFDWRVMLPGFSADLAHELGIFDTELSLPEAMKHFRIDEIAQEHGVIDENFSKVIRSRR